MPAEFGVHFLPCMKNVPKRTIMHLNEVGLTNTEICKSPIQLRQPPISWKTRIDVYETLCPQQMLVHKGGKIKNWGGECRDVTPTKSLSQNIRVDVNREVKFL